MSQHILWAQMVCAKAIPKSKQVQKYYMKLSNCPCQMFGYLVGGHFLLFNEYHQNLCVKHVKHVPQGFHCILSSPLFSLLYQRCADDTLGNFFDPLKALELFYISQQTSFYAKFDTLLGLSSLSMGKFFRISIDSRFLLL